MRNVWCAWSCVEILMGYMVREILGTPELDIELNVQCTD